MILEYFILPVQHRDSDAPPRSNRSTFYTLCSMGQYLSPEPLAGETDDQAFLVPSNRSGEGSIQYRAERLEAALATPFGTLKLSSH